jgi:hypothetical protein
VAPRPAATTRSRRRRALGLALTAAAVLVVAVLVIRSAGGTHRVHVVRVVTVPPRAITTPATTVTAAHGSAGPKASRSLAPASAGTNGSFTPPAGAHQSPLRAGARASFAHLTASLPGPVDVAVAPVAANGITVLGANSPAHGWSTTKVPVLVALLRARGAHGLTATEERWAQLAITESDNQSILDLFADLERLKGGLTGASASVQQVLRHSGDDHTVVATAPPPPGGVTTFGQTEWPPGASIRFFQALGRGCLLPAADTAHVVSLMENIVASEAWGLGQGGFHVPVAYKGGWGPESSTYLVRQSGIVDAGSPRAVAVSLVAHPPPGADAFTVGTQMLTQTAQWLAGELRLRSWPSAGCR